LTFSSVEPILFIAEVSAKVALIAPLWAVFGDSPSESDVGEKALAGNFRIVLSAHVAQNEGA